jgi:hypothetical protein
MARDKRQGRREKWQVASDKCQVRGLTRGTGLMPSAD